MSPESEARAHRRAREHGVSRPLYAFARALFTPSLRLWVRPHARGLEHVPSAGAAVLAPNHKSFWDPFFVGLVLRRPVRFMAKSEMFIGPFRWVLPRLGAFPVRRGESDAAALETARALLRAGELVVIFPEGTRVDEPDVLGSPHHGAGRLALETGAPIVPVAIVGSAKLFLGPLLKPRRVQVAFLEPIQVEPGREAELIDRVVWPKVAEEYGRLAATPGVLLTALAALGLGGGLIARRLARTGGAPRIGGVVQPRRVRRELERRRHAERVRSLARRFPRR